MKFNKIMLESAKSTNDYALDNFQPWTVFYTTNQTEGIGRKGDRWIESDGSAAISFCINSLSTKDDSIVLQKLALAVCKIITGSQIKWPNDVMLNDKKIAGILAKRSGEKFVIGIGVNVNNMAFDNSIIDKATSIILETGFKMYIPNLVSMIADKFTELLAIDCIEQINYHQWLSKKKIKIDECEYEFSGVASDGNAIIKNLNDSSTKTISNDISLSKMYK